MKAVAKYPYHVVLTPEPEGGYTVTVPALPGCVSYGRTVEDARLMIIDAIRGYLASARKHKQYILASTSERTIIATVLA